MRHALPLIILIPIVAACAANPSRLPTRTVIKLTEQQARGYGYAKEHCSSCHGIIANASSPNPEAPPFEQVVNKTALTARTLQSFLKDSHSFPSQMDFEIEPAKIDDLTAYMISLRRPGYNPPI